MSSSSDNHVSTSSDHSSFNIDHFTSTSSDHQILENMDEDDMAIFHCTGIAYDSHNFFKSHEIEEGARQSMDARVCIRDILTTM
jgi:hypothetical protein